MIKLPSISDKRGQWRLWSSAALKILVATLVPMLCSCEKELDFEYHYEPPKTVIEGTLDQHGVRVSLTLTTPMDEPMDRTRLTDATVTVEDLTAGTVRSLLPDADGYFTDATPGEPGHSYRLKVLRDGVTYTSDCLMKAPTEILEMKFRWVKMPYDHVAALRISLADIPGEESYYWVRLLRNGKGYQWMFINDKGMEDGTVKGATFTTRMDADEEDEKNRLVDGDVVTAIVTPVSLEMIDYLVALGNDSNGPAMFSGGFCLGYFLAAPVCEESVVFHPAEIEMEE